MNLHDLNPQQRQAVECINGPLLVLAGAGSGKTRVLTYRIANLIENHGVNPWNILALTFTNKAAREMRARTESLLGEHAHISDMWVSTFHSSCARILRRDIDRLGYERSFVIYDDADQLSVIAGIIKSMNLDDKKFSKRMLKDRISDAKNKSTDVQEHLLSGYAPDVVLDVYKQYQKKLKQSNALDFDDLLLKTVELFESCPDVLAYYQNKFRYILIDEYQDTNLIQYRLCKLLCGETKNICVVGDDDQSIYSWRGADIRNILEFEKDFPGAVTIRLEQNYRSTDVILDAANGVISNNQGRKAKRLWTEQKGGEPIECYTAQNERIESDYVCSQILSLVNNQGYRYEDFAVLYRMNAQSRVLETGFIGYGIPYRVYGGTRFYERKEIKDILAYLRLLVNPADDVAFLRVVNVPRRGLGEGALRELEQDAADRGIPLFLAAMDPQNVSMRVKPKLTRFTGEMTELIALRHTMPLAAFAEKILDQTGYLEYLKEDKKEAFETRAENISELLGAMREFEAGIEEDDVDMLQAYLENVSLLEQGDTSEEEGGQVALMTLHSAKGLEFKVVFLVGMEENIFPSFRAHHEPAQMEEERRLCYVGITRARERLFLIHAQQRSLFGDFAANAPSQFLDEIPPELMHREQRETQPQPHESARERRPRKSAEELLRQRTMHTGFGSKVDLPKNDAKSTQVKQYQRVKHAKFGVGTVLQVEGSGSAQVVSIDFGGTVKKFAAAFAPITPLEGE